MANRWVRAAGGAAIAGGLLIGLKGVAIAASDHDPSLVPAGTLLFSAGLVGLRIRLGRRRDVAARLGGAAAWVALAASAVDVAGQVVGATAPGEPGAAPLLVASYALATAAILVGLLVLGTLVFQSRALAGGWRAVPLAAGLVWFPLLGLGALVPASGEGLIPAGLAWAAVGLSLWRGARAPTS